MSIVVINILILTTIMNLSEAGTMEIKHNHGTPFLEEFSACLLDMLWTTLEIVPNVGP